LLWVYDKVTKKELVRVTTLDDMTITLGSMVQLSGGSASSLPMTCRTIVVTSDCLEFHLTALAHREEMFVLFLVHGAFPRLRVSNHGRDGARTQNANAGNGCGVAAEQANELEIRTRTARH
jgi:hypothetical protein